MQQADIEAARVWRRVADGQVVADVLLPVAVPVNRNVQLFQPLGFGLPRREHMHVLQRGELLRHGVLGVVIPPHYEYGNPCVPKESHLSEEEVARVVVPPVTVIEVTSEQQEIDLLGHAILDEILERLACRESHSLGWRAFIALQPAKWTVEVDIRSVDKCEGHAQFPTKLTQLATRAKPAERYRKLFELRASPSN